MSIEIVINNPGIIGPGDTVTGKIICTFHTQEHIRGIKCRFRGLEHTEWKKRRGIFRRFIGKNKVVSADDNFIGEGDMTPGRYEYTFAYSLPLTDVPSSYTHKFGTVRYYIEALVDRPFAFDYRKEVTIHVAAAPISLVLEQNMPTLRYPAEKTIGCLCCANGSISLEFILERDTYILGETINFRVQLINNSDSEVRMLKVQLLKHIEFTTQYPFTRRKIENDCIVGIEKTAGAPPKNQKIYNISLDIPDTTPIHNFSNCILFEQWFTLNVTAVLPTFHSNLGIAARLDVGHSFLGTSTDTQSSTIPSAPTNSSVIPFHPERLGYVRLA